MKEKTYFGIEGWTHNNVVDDLLKEGEQVFSEEKFGEQIQIIHYKSHTVDIAYTRGNSILHLKIFGKEGGSKDLLKLLEQKINEYNEEYCGPKGL